MTAPSAIPDGDSITVTDSTAGNSVVASATKVSLVDDVAANCLQSGYGTNGTDGAGGLVIILHSNCSIAAGDTVKIGLTVNDPTANFYFIVSSTVNGTTVDSNTVTINSVPPTIVGGLGDLRLHDGLHDRRPGHDSRCRLSPFGHHAHPYG